MGLSERTLKKLRAEVEESGSKVYEDDDDIPEDDITYTEEDDDPTTLVGDLDGDVDVDEDDRPVGEVPDAGEENA